MCGFRLPDDGRGKDPHTTSALAVFPRIKLFLDDLSIYFILEADQSFVNTMQGSTHHKHKQTVPQESDKLDRG